MSTVEPTSTRRGAAEPSAGRSGTAGSRTGDSRTGRSGTAGSRTGGSRTGRSGTGDSGTGRARTGRSRDLRLPRRLVKLFAGLALFGVSVALIVTAGLGADPWDVFHQGVARATGTSLGQVIVVLSGIVLLLWIPLRQRPGFGTLANAVLVGVFADITIAVIDQPRALAARTLMMLVGIVLNGVATGMYIGADLGPGPRDGLMTGLAARGWSIRLVRTGVEVVVLIAGWRLGGTVGVGTVLYALAIGPLAQVFIPLFSPTDRLEPSHDR